MAIDYAFAVEGDLLEVRTSGFDESADEVIAYGMAVIAAAVEHESHRVLCLEGELEYRLGTTDIYHVGSYVAAQAPRVARVALVCAPESIGDARFWEDVTSNRGLQAAVFTDEAEARRWLDAGRGSAPGGPGGS